MECSQQKPQFNEEINTRLNSSSVIFKQLIDSLRQKNKKKYNNNSYNKSQINPQDNLSGNTNQFYSERNQLQSPQKVSNLYTNYKQLQTGEDTIQLKPRGSIAGRDIINKKSTQLSFPKHSFDHVVCQNKEQLKNKITRTYRGPQNNIDINDKNQDCNRRRQNQKHVRQNNNKYLPNLTHNSIVFSQVQKPIQQKQHSPQVKIFTQNKFNKQFANSKCIKDIDDKIVKKYCQIQFLTQFSQVKDVYAFFMKLCQLTSVHIDNPFIKKFKNCVYFGNQINFEVTYEGFLYYYDHKIYFGQFFAGQKQGNGTQILMIDNQIYRGEYLEGQKNGKFEVIKETQQYIGMLKNGVYEGMGKLVTKDSIYQGCFVKGEKQGYGEQIFPKTGLKLTGYYNEGVFNKQKRTVSSLSKPQLHMNHYHKQNREQLQRRSSYQDNYGQLGSRKNQKITKTGNTFLSKQSLSRKRNFFNHQKLVSMGYTNSKQPSMMNTSRGCQQYDYSFDNSINKDVETCLPLGVANHNYQYNNFDQSAIRRNPFVQKSLPINKMFQTNQFQQPLPVPCFYVRK